MTTAAVNRRSAKSGADVPHVRAASEGARPEFSTCGVTSAAHEIRHNHSEIIKDTEGAKSKDRARFIDGGRISRKALVRRSRRVHWELRAEEKG